MILLQMVAIASGIIWQGRISFILIFAILFVGVPLGFFLLLWLMVELKKGEISDRYRKVLFFSIQLFLMSVAAWGIGKGTNRLKVHQIRNFVAEAVPKLDAYRDKHGTYPHSLNELQGVQLSSWWCDACHYSANGNHFSFDYWDESQMMAGYFFDSGNREWVFFD